MARRSPSQPLGYQSRLARPARTTSDVPARFFVNHAPVDVYEAYADRMRRPDNICNFLNRRRYVSGANFPFIQNDRGAIRCSTKELKPESPHLVSARRFLLNFSDQVGLTYWLPRRC